MAEGNRKHEGPRGNEWSRGEAAFKTEVPTAGVGFCRSDPVRKESVYLRPGASVGEVRGRPTRDEGKPEAGSLSIQSRLGEGTSDPN